ncbi:MAG: TerC family protein [Akkermansiaceae bacterium]|nr:TerC family protein [Armatimonadota bacterium]
MILPSVSPGDLFIVGTLIVLEGLLSADNALVLAILVKHLPKEQQKKALLYGLVGAFILRGTAIFFARFLMGVWWLCGVGAIYLMFLAGKHFLSRHQEDDPDNPKVGASFWATVVQVEFTDLIFAVDSILVAVALVHDPAKVWIVYTGGFLGILLLRLAASFFIRLITKYPALDHMAYGLVGWAGLKLASAAVDIRAESLHLPEPHYLPSWAFWVGFGLIAVFGSLYAVKAGRTAADEEKCEDAEDSLEQLEEGDFVFDRVPPPGPPVDTAIPTSKEDR